MAANHAIGADHLDGVDRIRLAAASVGGRDRRRQLASRLLGDRAWMILAGDRGPQPSMADELARAGAPAAAVALQAGAAALWATVSAVARPGCRKRRCQLRGTPRWGLPRTGAIHLARRRRRWCPRGRRFRSRDLVGGAARIVGHRIVSHLAGPFKTERWALPIVCGYRVRASATSPLPADSTRHVMGSISVVARHYREESASCPVMRCAKTQCRAYPFSKFHQGGTPARPGLATRECPRPPWPRSCPRPRPCRPR